MSKNYFTKIIVCFAAVVWSAAHGALPPECGSLDNAYGPWDYTNPEHFSQRLFVVERAHFTQDVFNLKNAGRRFERSPPGGGIDYTLRAFPNHHRALDALVRLVIRDKTKKPADMNYTIDCFFARAMEFNPKDPTVPMIYGTYFYRIEQYKEALNWYKFSESIGKPTAELYYNMGLTSVKLNDIESAQTYATKAYDLGYPLPWLRDYLRDLQKKRASK
jgi:tetratricopeptide (TPR) repeat protein